MKTYTLVHICVKSENGLMHREEEDYRCGISKMALAAFRTESHIYAYAFMSTHVHIIVQSSDCSKFILFYRSAYTRWFNHKYGRTGRLGERYYHSVVLETPYRILNAVNYVLKYPVHWASPEGSRKREIRSLPEMAGVWNRGENLLSLKINRQFLGNAATDIF